MSIRSSIGSMIAAALAITAFGCSSSDSGGGSTAPGSVSSGIPDSTVLSTLTAAQITQLNKAVTDYETAAGASLSKAQVCGGMGYLMAGMQYALATATPDATLQASCKSTADQCNQAAATPSPGSSSGGSTGESTTTLTGCTATVAQFQACAKDKTDAILAVFKNAPACNSLTGASMAGATTSAATPPSCDTLATACPNAEMAM